MAVDGFVAIGVTLQRVIPRGREKNIGRVSRVQIGKFLTNHCGICRDPRGGERRTNVSVAESRPAIQIAIRIGN